MTPTWDGKRWRIRVMRDGRKFSFSSSVPGAKGRRECQKKYDAWYFGEGSGEKTVGTVASEYLEDLKARRGETSGSYFQANAYIRLYIVPKLSSKKICKVSSREWQNLINEAHSESGKPLSHKTLSNLRSIIMGIVKFGYADFQCELLRSNLYIPQGREKKEKEILQLDDVQRLFEPSDEWFHPAFCLAILTGLRPGELLGLKTSDIHGDHISIQRAINDRGYITDGKNKNARRIIPIGRLASVILNDTIERNKNLKLHTDWIFCSHDGSNGTQIAMRKSWNRLKEERNLPGTPYSLRHTFISLMKNVMPEQMVKDIVGHSASMPTFEVYGHILDGESRRAAEIVDLTFSDRFAQSLPKEVNEKP